MADGQRATIEGLRDLKGEEISLRDLRLVLSIALIRKFSAIPAIIHSHNKHKNMSIGVEQFSKALLSNSVEDLASLLNKKEDKIKRELEN